MSSANTLSLEVGTLVRVARITEVGFITGYHPPLHYIVSWKDYPTYTSFTPPLRLSVVALLVNSKNISVYIGTMEDAEEEQRGEEQGEQEEEGEKTSYYSEIELITDTEIHWVVYVAGDIGSIAYFSSLDKALSASREIAMQGDSALLFKCIKYSYQ